MAVSREEYLRMNEKQKSITMFDMLVGIANVQNVHTQQQKEHAQQQKANAQKLNSLSNDVASLKDSTKLVSDRIQAAEVEFQAVKDDIKAFKETCKEKFDSSLSSDAFHREIDDIARRRRNICIYGLKESTQPSRQEKQQHDKSVVTTLFNDISSDPTTITFPSPSSNFKIWNRVGPINERRPRPLIVEMASEEAKHRMLSSLNRLQGKPQWKGVTLSDDRTKSQRENDKKVYDELKAIQEAKNVAMSEEEKNDFVHIIVGRPGDYRVKKVRKRKN